MKFDEFRQPVLAALFTGAALVAASAQTRAYEMPSQVSLRNKYESFTFETQYFLLDGKIWSRPNEVTTGKHGPWTLFQGTGVPFGPDCITLAWLIGSSKSTKRRPCSSR